MFSDIEIPQTINHFLLLKWFSLGGTKLLLQTSLKRWDLSGETVNIITNKPVRQIPSLILEGRRRSSHKQTWTLVPAVPRGKCHIASTQKRPHEMSKNRLKFVLTSTNYIQMSTMKMKWVWMHLPYLLFLWLQGVWIPARKERLGVFEE